MSVRAWTRHFPDMAPPSSPAMNRKFHIRAQSLAAGMLLLGGCASTPDPALDAAASKVSAQWHAQLPHQGEISNLSEWWSQFDDPLLTRLIESGQRVSPTLADAAVRVVEARANRTIQRANLLPLLDGSAGNSRGRSELGQPVSDVASSSLNVSWELDVFGANRAGARAAQAQLDASRARWHDARVLVAAEIARTYTDLRVCEALITQAELELASYEQTTQVVDLLAKAGFETRAGADQARAAAAQGQSRLIEQRAGCDLLVKSLVSLTDADESVLHRDLDANAGTFPSPVDITVGSVPAEVLAQRPDLFASARELEQASAEADRANALRWPRVTFTGNIGKSHARSEGVTTDGTVWSVGPVAVTIPLFDGGAARANASAAHARYEASVVTFAARLREAVREVESALVTLDSTASRSTSASAAAAGFASAYAAVNDRYRSGAANLFELEEVRRSMIAADRAVVSLRRERIVAWIDLYRAVGGGWSRDPINTADPQIRQP